MNKRSHHEHHQEVVIDVEPPLHRPGHHQWVEIIHPKVSLVVVTTTIFFLGVLFLFWVISHHDEVVSLADVLWRAILALLTMAVTWIMPILMVAGTLGLVIKWNIKPIVEVYHQVQEAFGLRARNKVLVREQHYTVIDEPNSIGKLEPKFYQV